MDAYYISSDMDALTTSHLLDCSLIEEDRTRLREQPFQVTDNLGYLLYRILETEMEKHAADIITRGFITLHAWYAYNLTDAYRASFSQNAHEQALHLRERVPVEHAMSLALHMKASFDLLKRDCSVAPLIYRVGRTYLLPLF